MPDRRTPTAAERSANLVRDAATAAVDLALSGHEKATEAAVARALRDQRVDGVLQRHEQRLDAMNGSQEETVKALGELRDGQATLLESSARADAVAEALALQGSELAGARLSKRTLILTALGVIAAYLAVLIPLVYVLASG